MERQGFGFMNVNKKIVVIYILAVLLCLVGLSAFIARTELRNIFIENDSYYANFGSKQVNASYATFFPEVPLVVVSTLQQEKGNAVVKGLFSEKTTSRKKQKKYVRIYEQGKEICGFEARLRTRGNISAQQPKKPYRIISRDKIFINCEHQFGTPLLANNWVLIKCEDLNLLVGFFISHIVQGLPLPSIRFVNVIKDERYKGSYFLLESLTDIMKEKLINEDGYLLENDLYWFKENVHFETYKNYEDVKYNNKWNMVQKYTFKYPRAKDNQDEKVLRIKGYIDHFEKYLYSNDLRFREYYDVESFVNWLLVHDIINTWDAQGSNMFVYVPSFGADKVERRLRMGPVWDLDTALSRDVNSNTMIRGSRHFYYNKLIHDKEFNRCYVRRWQQVKEQIRPYVSKQLKDLLNKQGESIQKSWNMDAKRWGTVPVKLGAEIRRIDEYLQERIEWLNRNVGVL